MKPVRFVFVWPVHRRCFIFFSKTLASAEREKEIFSPSLSLPLVLAVNKSPAVFIFYHARSTDLDEKIEGL